MSSRLAATRNATFGLLSANILVFAGIFFFAAGFFPYKPLLQGLSEYNPLAGNGLPPQPPFDRLVFMVVDALRR